MKQVLKQVLMLPCFTDQEPHLSRQRKAEWAMSRCQSPATPKRQPAQRCGANVEDMGTAWDFRDQELRVELLRAAFDLCGSMWYLNSMKCWDDLRVVMNLAWFWCSVWEGGAACCPPKTYCSGRNTQTKHLTVSLLN